MKNWQLQGLNALRAKAADLAIVGTGEEYDSPVIPESADELAQWAENEASHATGYGQPDIARQLLALADETQALARSIREDGRA